MKKIISGLTALAIMAAAAMPASAMFAAETTDTEPVDNNTTIQPKGGDPFDVTPNPETADAEVGFSVDPAFTVVIPAKVEMNNFGAFMRMLDPTAKDYLSGAADITAENVFLEPEQVISVTIASDDGKGFALTHEKKADCTIPYGISQWSDTADDMVDIEDGGVCAEFGTSDEKQERTIVFATLNEFSLEFAGNYSDTVVFGISVKGGEQS